MILNKGYERNSAMRRRLIHEENHEGFHGHYNKEPCNLVSPDDLESLSRPEASTKLLSRHVAASRRAEKAVVCDRDFVSIDIEEAGGVQTSVLDDVFRKVSNGGDFRRGGFMFTPVVNSVMKSVAVEAKQKGVRIIGGTTTAPRQSSVPEGDIKTKMKALRRKRHEVSNFDKKHGRIQAKVISKGTLEIRKEALVVSGDNNADSDSIPSSAVPFSVDVPKRPNSAVPSAIHSINRSNYRSIREVSQQTPFSTTADPQPNGQSSYSNSRPKSAGAFTSSQPPTGLTGSRRRPNIKNQKSVYAQVRKKKESDRIKKTLFTEQSDDESDDLEFNTFKTDYNRRKRPALLTVKDPELLRRESLPEQQQQETLESPKAPPSQKDIALFIHQNSFNESNGKRDIDEEKVANSVKMAAFFIGKMFGKKNPTSPTADNTVIYPTMVSSNTGENESTDAEIAPLRPFSQQDSEAAEPEDHNEERAAIKKHTRGMVQFAPTSVDGHSGAPMQPSSSPNKDNKSPRKQFSLRVREPENRVPSKREQLEEWLAKKMESLLSDYLLGNTKVDNLMSEEEKLRQIYDERTIAMEISLLYRGFQSIDKNNDGFLQSEDLYQICVECNVKLRKEEIQNAMWLMDDNMRGYLTFDEVMNFYLRKRREFLASGNEYKMREQVEAEELAKMKLHQQQYILTECDMHSNPLLLFRMLFFVAMQDKKGEVHLLSAFQNLSQLFGRVAEEQFNCIFLRNFAQITDQDRFALADFVDHIKTFRVKVQRTKVVIREHKARKAVLIRLKGKGGESVAANRRNAVVTNDSGRKLMTRGYTIGTTGAEAPKSANVVDNTSRQIVRHMLSFT